MTSDGEKFIVRVNPAAFGYRAALVLVRTSNRITKDDVIQRVKQFGDLAYHVHHMGRTSVAALIINKPLDDNITQSLNDRLKPATVISIAVSELSLSTGLSETDLRIIKCLLLSGARMEISEIAKEVRISEKTTTRRLNGMKEGHLLDFSLQCDPASMIGYIQFAIPITVTKSYYRSVLERMYSEFQANILYSPGVISFNSNFYSRSFLKNNTSSVLLLWVVMCHNTNFLYTQYHVSISPILNEQR
jgi:DNA-binding Lrp family transcriptional regulator